MDLTIIVGVILFGHCLYLTLKDEVFAIFGGLALLGMEVLHYFVIYGELERRGFGGWENLALTLSIFVCNHVILAGICWIVYLVYRVVTYLAILAFFSMRDMLFMVYYKISRR